LIYDVIAVATTAVCMSGCRPHHHMLLLLAFLGKAWQ
jgi:hypothetical protein